MDCADIKGLDRSTILTMCSNQVIIDLQGVVKELIENSLDAESTSIQVKFIDFGLEGIEVIDNGKGIKEIDFDEIARWGSTSKLSTHEDLSRLKTLGFRGEALSSIANVAKLSVVTWREDDDWGFKLLINSSGEV